MSMITCRHCGVRFNGHQLVYLTCVCGRPYGSEVTEIGKLDLSSPYVELRLDDTGHMCMHTRRVYFGKSPLSADGRKVYADADGVLYLIGEYPDIDYKTKEKET
jgi:hypothetical protein